jgi:hypothetical protein
MHQQKLKKGLEWVKYLIGVDFPSWMNQRGAEYFTDLCEKSCCKEDDCKNRAWFWNENEEVWNIITFKVWIFINQIVDRAI